MGRRQYFQGGTIYWKLNEAYFVAGAIRDKWGETGWESGYLGYPISDEAATADGTGRFNRFEHGMIYWHPDTGAHVVTGTVLDAWAAAGYERSRLWVPGRRADQPGRRGDRRAAVPARDHYRARAGDRRTEQLHGLHHP
nr:hypothetical protein [Nocardia otitidiscaviarum]